MTRTEWQDATTTLAARIDSIPDPQHPAVRPLIERHAELLSYGLEHEFITPEGAARS